MLVLHRETVLWLAVFFFLLISWFVASIRKKKKRGKIIYQNYQLNLYFLIKITKNFYSFVLLVFLNDMNKILAQ